MHSKNSLYQALSSLMYHKLFISYVVTTCRGNASNMYYRGKPTKMVSNPHYAIQNACSFGRCHNQGYKPTLGSPGPIHLSTAMFPKHDVHMIESSTVEIIQLYRYQSTSFPLN